MSRLRKNSLFIFIGILFISVILQGCSKENKFLGTWYSEGSSEITFNKDGTFQSDWILDGQYQIKDDKVVISSNVDTQELEYKKTDENETLVSGTKVYYRTKEELEKIIEKAKKSVYESVKTNIVSKWEKTDNTFIEFFEDGTYKSNVKYGFGSLKELSKGSYTIKESMSDEKKDYCIIEIIEENGATIRTEAKIEDNKLILENDIYAEFIKK